jgi:hypothetical protein
MTRWRYFVILDLLCASLFSLAGDAAPSSAGVNPEAAELLVWIGHWKTTGESGGVPWHADTRCAWSVNRGFVVCDQLINQNINQLMVLAYDSANKSFRISSLGKNREPVVARGVVERHVWTNTGEFKQNGKKILTKTIVDFSQPNHYADEEMTSEDGGAHWTVVSKGRSIKIE